MWHDAVEPSEKLILYGRAVPNQPEMTWRGTARHGAALRIKQRSKYYQTLVRIDDPHLYIPLSFWLQLVSCLSFQQGAPGVILNLYYFGLSKPEITELFSLKKCKLESAHY